MFCILFGKTGMLIIFTIFLTISEIKILAMVTHISTILSIIVAFRLILILHSHPHLMLQVTAFQDISGQLNPNSRFVWGTEVNDLGLLMSGMTSNWGTLNGD